ncbi:TrbG/VirB9 family P-type conjugative transfer protein [Aurantiacibacter sediminis]|uniref:TrbG/VirB9 family P-type conjugative transfer protein n=1 Tax=Aurantiacibacter sediminis TaxID=2793064 RepID=A0ABS0N3A8_9SPHN|nr:TrbG/VirB9 family P-type conjugative transfer protein [Aurantiacibacter sediminis]MBH5321760.1 TrbG/VirB9 family P-type conjugative transfer protein [Aurantiacibacter sediminis]
MLRALSCSIAAALAFTTLAAPAAHAQDPRLLERLYDPTQVVRIEGRTNVQTTIQFGEGERIENVAVGNSATWQVTPSRSANLLFVKPLEPRAATNMTVVTNRHTYLFDLVANPGNRTPLYILTFTYPEELVPDDETGMAMTPLPEANSLEMAAANDDLAVLDPADLNFQWSSTGTAALVPEEIYDNGRATFLNWPEDRALPAILLMDRDGNEGPVNYAVRGDTIVLDLVPGEIILRSGDDEARLVNFGIAGAFLADGTARADADRD